MMLERVGYDTCIAKYSDSISRCSDIGKCIDPFMTSLASTCDGGDF